MNSSERLQRFGTLPTSLQLSAIHTEELDDPGGVGGEAVHIERAINHAAQPDRGLVRCFGRYSP